MQKVLRANKAENNKRNTFLLYASNTYWEYSAEVISALVWLSTVRVICIQQCSEILLKLLKALYHHYETLALQHTQQCKHITSSILCKQLPLSELSSPATKYLPWNLQLSSWKLHGVTPLLLPVQSWGSNNADFQLHGTPQPTLLYHTLPLLLPWPGNVLYLTHDQITDLNRIF